MRALNELDHIAIVGRSCRLPGAASVAKFWELLASGRCAVSKIPPDRWSLERIGHPRSGERGRSYTWAAGILDNIWGFDPTAFGLSPREAEQMDPQQRLALELTWEALEDAGIRPSQLAGSETGVFIGASALDYGNLRALDMASGDAYFATGNTLSIISNRISYVFDLHGPSLTVDTACSSALVALNEAVAALRSGRIDTAIVGGVNILASPVSFIGFSQATMLSRTGLCQSFSAKADGYVRAEGGVVLVLRSGKALDANDRVHGLIAGSRINSDGRTTGIALPSSVHQSALLSRVYNEAGIDFNRLAFIEAHGTGTRVGDPAEANAIGEVLGKRRTDPLLIGSVKTNIGHTEPASGLAGILKAMLALENDCLPASLHCSELNPDIDFEGLNLRVCASASTLERRDEIRFAGVSSFGFGGTNAHVVIADAPPREPAQKRAAPSYLLLSAHSRPALAGLASDYAARLEAETPEQGARIIAALGHRREHLAQRLVIPVESPEKLGSALRSAAADPDGEALSSIATALSREVPVAFVYSGNGSQFAGMGRAAYAQNAAFKAHFDAADRIFGKLAGWSLAEELHHGELEQRLTLTRIAQPLLFAIQSATTHALKIEGLAPSFVFGHSVGEVAAAEAAGILDLENAVHVIHFRSLHQELTRDTGKMAVVFGSPETIELILAELPDLEIAASNSPRAYTLSGDSASLGRLSKVARAHKARVHPLDLAYPFHSKLMEPVQKPLIEDLSDIVARDSAVPFISTVEGEEISGVRLKADYWWRNVREPVRFMEAIRESARLGARIFIEIGPAATLLAHVKDTVEATHQTIASFSILDRKDQDGDPIKRGFARALAHGAKVDWDAAFGNDPGAAVPLASYPWQWQDYRLRESVEAAAIIRPAPWHPLIGARYSADSLEWHSVIDTLLVPQLADHQIDGQVVLPGSAFVEMAIAVARDWLGTDGATITDLEIFSPLHLSGEGSREISCRLTPALNFIEISSRPRLGHTPWQLHAVARIVKEAGAAAESATLPESDRKDIAGDELYAIARQAGLQFGPAFRNVASASRLPAEVIMVDLIAPTEASVFGLDPARLDSCFHGLILTFADLTGKDRRTAFVPVRFDEVRLVKPGTAIARARIDIVSCNERAIIANYVLVDEAGELVAILRGARYQAFRSSRQAELASHALYQRQILASEPTAARNDAALRADELRALGKNLLADSEAATASQSATLLEGWATAAAVALVRALGQKAGLDAESFAAAGLLPISAKSWFANLLAALESSGLLKRDATGLSLDESIALPEPDAILETIASDHPECSAELLLAASATVSLQRLSAGDLEALSAGIAGFAVDGFELGGDQPTHSASLLADLLQHSLASWPQDRALRILQIGYGPLSTRALSLARKSGARLTIFEPDRRRAGRARLGFRPNDGVELVEKLTEASGPFDLVIGVDALHRSLRDPSLWSSLRDLLSPGAVFCAIEPAPSFFRDLTFGLDPAWFEQTVSGQPLGAILSDKAWVQRIALAGLTDVISDTLSTPTGAAFLLTGQIADIALESHGSGKALIITDNFETGGAVAPPLARLLETSGLHTSLTPDSELDSFATGETPELIVYIASPMPAGLLPVEALTHQCLCLKRCVDRLALRKAKIWIVTGGGPEAGTESDIGVGLAAFSRTLANEFPMLEVHRVTIAPDLPLEDAAGRLRDLILSKTGETDIILRAQGTNVLRFEAPDVRGHAGQTIAEAARLERGEGAGTDRLHWAPTERQTPGPGEVEIAVEATGLNFRDVMFALGILPPSILENGFAGPTMGLECAGTVLRIGPEVAGFKPGNRVIAFARGGFATHVIVPAHVVALAPEGLSAATAATIPVAFLTAFYALVTCAHLKRREWVLIHGGAGGVGLAALQIAQWRGARVIATAGSPEKRALLKMLGAEHVFDSRSGAFVDDVRRATRDGVHVVLNSLSGEAMERSLGLLRPFGRFIELGKRDYVANTPIGLRPFRQNLSYFGVDLDQLILNDAKAGKKLFQNVMALFAKGILAPLPHRTFEAAEIGDAFRLMQQSHHIGKILIKPPAPGEVHARTGRPFEVSSEKTHLITGGLGGFGLETANWLADKGARHILLVGRSGAASEAAQETIARLKTRGVEIYVKALDISDAAAVAQLFASFGTEMPDLAGVMHEAMVLEDAIIANLDAEKMEHVLRPKVAGAELLDHMTQHMDLDYFVLFSSATTLIGNPGQAAYVAANGFLEGMARRRRRAGLPALAVAWGAIEDVGVLTRAQTTKDSLANRTGVKGLKARDGLNLMAEALSQGQVSDDVSDDDACIAIAPINWSTARDRLPVLRSPTYSHLSQEAQADTGETGRIDLKALLATESPDSIRKIVSDNIVEEIARVLCLPREDVNRSKPLSDIGLDSLMAVELALGLEQRFGLDAPLATSTSGFSVGELAEHMIGLASESISEPDLIAKGVAKRHLGSSLEPEILDTMSERVQKKSEALKDILL